MAEADSVPSASRNTASARLPPPGSSPPLSSPVTLTPNPTSPSSVPSSASTPSARSSSPTFPPSTTSSSTFVNLSNKLVDVDSAIVRMRAPVVEFRPEKAPLKNKTGCTKAS